MNTDDNDLTDAEIAAQDTAYRAQCDAADAAHERARAAYEANPLRRVARVVLYPAWLGYIGFWRGVWLLGDGLAWVGRYLQFAAARRVS